MKKSYKKLFMFVIVLMLLLQTTAFGMDGEGDFVDGEPEEGPPPEPTKYSLVIDSTDGGSVNFEGSFKRASGTIFDIEINEEEGYEFVKWTGDTDMLNSKGDVVLYKDTSLTAVFEKIQEEVIEEKEDEVIEEEEEVLDNEAPEGATEHPETGGIPLDVLGGAGAILIGIGAILKKRNR